jgi:hypothetical protein
MAVLGSHYYPGRDSRFATARYIPGSTDPVILPRTGSTGGRSLHQDRPHYLTLAGTDGTMPREPHLLISTRMATSVAEERRTERLSLRAAIILIGLLSLGGWAVIIAVVLGLD